MAIRLTVNVQGALGLDDDRRLLGELARATGVEWRIEPVGDDGHLSGGLVEIVLVAVLSKSTELAYGAAVENVRKRLDQWRSERLDKPGYTVSEQTVAEGGEGGGEDGQPEQLVSGD